MFCNILDGRRSVLLKKVDRKIINFNKLSTIQKLIALVANTERDITVEILYITVYLHFKFYA